MSKVEERALEVYPEKLSYDSMVALAVGNPTDENAPKRSIYIQGYEQGEKDCKEKMKGLLNKAKNNITDSTVSEERKVSALSVINALMMSL